jgi:DNA (cytosine-5)-methyltransferase 1
MSGTQTTRAEAASAPPSFRRYSTARIGENKNAPRVYISGRYLHRANFRPAQRIEATFEKGRVTVRLAERGARVVSAKKDGAIPVIDLNSQELRRAFGAVQVLQVQVTPGEIILTPLQTEEKRRTRCRNGREGSFYSGVGLMTKAAQLAGYKPRFAVEIDERFAAIYTENFPESTMFNMSIADVPVDELRALPVELLNISAVCGPYSNVRTVTRGQGKRDRAQVPEASPDGDLTMWAAAFIHLLNPATIVFEQVPAWLESGAGASMKGYLERLGYKVETKIFDGNQYGELQKRKRAVMVAHSDDGSFNWPEPSPVARTLGDELDPEEEVAGEYFTEKEKGWLFEHWRKQAAKGNNFKGTKLTRESTSVPAIKSRYFAQQGDNPVVCHPSENSVRWFTFAEARRLQGIPEDFYLGEQENKTVAGAALGQGVIVSLFQKIIAAATGRAKGVKPETPEGVEFAGQMALAFA